MKTIYLIIILFFLNLFTLTVFGQKDIQPPLAPILQLVSVQPETGYSEINWTSSISPDVAGYVIYTFHNGEGYAFDTIWDPFATTITNTGSASRYFSESYVVAAIDSSDNISPLSNAINTIFTRSEIDTCRKKLIINWNKFTSFPNAVAGYRIMASVNEGVFSEIGSTDKEITTFTVTDFETDSYYCFLIKAVLGSSLSSSSNKTCIETKMQQPPGWINADYATVTDDNKIKLSFSNDPSSEIHNFKLERKSEFNGSFNTIATISTQTNPIIYTDNIDDPDQVYYYRISAINNCESPVMVSNIAGNILPTLKLLDNEIGLKWNPYREWNGIVSSYRIFCNSNGNYQEISSLPASDTSITIRYSELMFDISEKQVCFYVKAEESSNPYVSDAESRSSVVCSDIIEIITVPNAFTPNNDLINDGFRPVLSFTPEEYRLIIRNREGYVVFETSDPQQEWNGKKNGVILSPDVYLWYLNIIAPSGKVYTRTGTVAIINK